MLRSTYRVGFPLQIEDTRYMNNFDRTEEQKDYIIKFIEPCDETIQKLIGVWEEKNNQNKDQFTAHIYSPSYYLYIT